MIVLSYGQTPEDDRFTVAGQDGPALARLRRDSHVEAQGTGRLRSQRTHA